ncbi:hypothetical protein DPMN_006624 [Dreissena polymorpha]|uniref:Uncharacterized protein n=1 Tax=Dreissena polymorpha TaxID=45954 RepID=A0A9D4MSR6_DREPO|nr:hypothetical protein DPMN_006624 [Dreissena polymorpha]
MGHSERMCVSMEPARVPVGCERGPRHGICGKGRQVPLLEETDALAVLPCEHIVSAFEQLKLQAEEVCILLFNVYKCI